MNRRDAASDLERFRAYRETKDRRLRDELMADYRGVAVALAQRMAHRGEPLDDLIQVAEMAVLRAIDRFDPDRNTAFVAFAVPTVLGELKRHFRDQTWSVRVPRPTKELYVRLGKVVNELTLELNRTPTVAELAAELSVAEESVLEAIEAGAGYRSSSMSTLAVRTHAEVMGGRGSEGTSEESALTRVTVRGLIETLPDRERRILYLRFYEDLTQAEIGEILGISQMHVSRLLRQSLEILARRLGDVSADAGRPRSTGA